MKSYVFEVHLSRAAPLSIIKALETAGEIDATAKLLASWPGALEVRVYLRGEKIASIPPDQDDGR